MTPEQAPKSAFIPRSIEYQRKDKGLTTIASVERWSDTDYEYIRSDRVELMVRLAVLDERMTCMYSNNVGGSYYDSLKLEINQLKEQLQ